MDPVPDWAARQIVDTETGAALIEVPDEDIDLWDYCRYCVQEKGYKTAISVWDWEDATGQTGQQLGGYDSRSANLMLLDPERRCGYRVFCARPDEFELEMQVRREGAARAELEPPLDDWKFPR